MISQLPRIVMYLILEQNGKIFWSLLLDRKLLIAVRRAFTDASQFIVVLTTVLTYLEFMWHSKFQMYINDKLSIQSRGHVGKKSSIQCLSIR